MHILYHVTMPLAPMADCDATIQDVRALQRHAQGRLFHLYPGRQPGTRFPRRLWGLHLLPKIWHAEQTIDLHHVFNPDPYRFELLRWFRRPIVYTVIAGVHSTLAPAARRIGRQVHTLVVPTHEDVHRLQEWGVRNVVCVRPGIDVSGFSYHAAPQGGAFTLLMGSAPWTMEQFESKGVNALLDAAQRRQDLRLIFLWRQVHYDEMVNRVRSRGLLERVEILNEHVDVNRVLARCHAAIVLASQDGLIKAYPHSLLEALAAGKPVLISRVIPMASWIEQTGSGTVFERVEAGDILRGVESLEQNYAHYVDAAGQLRNDIAHEPWKEYLSIYEQIIATNTRFHAKRRVKQYEVRGK